MLLASEPASASTELLQSRSAGESYFCRAQVRSYGCGGNRSNTGNSCARSIQPMRSAIWMCTTGGAYYVQIDACALLQVTDNAEEVSRLRIAAWTKHANQALGRRAGSFPKFFEADRCLDVVAQDRLAGLDIAAQHRIDTFAPRQTSCRS
jgi:hypothetical protein